MKLLQFKAIWCGPCRQQTKEFEENPIDVELQAIDVDGDEELAKEYNIRSIPTMILLDDNKEVLYRWTGLTKSSTINKFIKFELHKVIRNDKERDNCGSTYASKSQASSF